MSGERARSVVTVIEVTLLELFKTNKLFRVLFYLFVFYLLIKILMIKERWRRFQDMVTFSIKKKNKYFWCLFGVEENSLVCFFSYFICENILKCWKGYLKYKNGCCWGQWLIWPEMLLFLHLLCVTCFFRHAVLFVGDLGHISEL